MGTDDGVCDESPNGQHRWVLDELVRAGAGLAQVHKCSWCGAGSYEASAGDDPRRSPR